MIKSSQLRVLDVVNLTDGSHLGLVRDLEIDLETGQITALIVPRPHQNWLQYLFRKEMDCIIPWEKVIKIGRDVILVEIETDDSLH